jgi:hypothetical protein
MEQKGAAESAGAAVLALNVQVVGGEKSNSTDDHD